MKSPIESKQKLSEQINTDILPSNFFNLNIICVQEMCEWLNLKDFHALAMTCKLQQRYVGDFFQQNYSATRIICANDGIQTYRLKREDIPAFGQFIRKVMIENNPLNDRRFQIIATNCKRWLREIIFKEMTLRPDQVQCISKILERIQILHFDRVKIDGNFHKNVLMHCQNIRTLSVLSFNSIPIGADNTWLLRKYPHLENFELAQQYGSRIEELDTFLAQNQQIRTIAVSSGLLLCNRSSFLGSNLTLDTFSIRLDHYHPSRNDLLYDLIIELHKRGFYRKLHVYAVILDSKMSKKLMLLPDFTKLYVSDTIGQVELSHLVNLKEIGFRTSRLVNNTTNLAHSLVNLERVYFYESNYDTILSFMSQSKKLNQMKVRHFVRNYPSNDSVLNLPELNQKRQKSIECGKTKIYIEEAVFLSTKWALSTIDFDKIKMILGESYDWGHCFMR